MRQPAQKEQIEKTFTELAKRCKSPGRIYVAGTYIRHCERSEAIQHSSNRSWIATSPAAPRNDESFQSNLAVAAPELIRYPSIDPNDFPEMHLYHLLAEIDSDTAHARMNDYVRRLVSFENALEQDLTQQRHHSQEVLHELCGKEFKLRNRER